MEMPIEATPTSDPRVITSQGMNQDKNRNATFRKWFLPASFLGLSGFILTSELLDSVQFLEGNLFIIKILASSLGGVVGFVAAVRSGAFR